MAITRIQLGTLAPNATAATLDELFRLNADKHPVIDRILAEAGISSPESLAHFLTIALLASGGLTNFNSDVYGIGASDWLAARARDWHDARLGEEAERWDMNLIVAALTPKLSIAADWPTIWAKLDEVCGLMGIENRMEEFAFEG